MNELMKLLVDNGISVVIVGLFLWDWVVNRKKVTESVEQNTKILEEMKTANENTRKSLDLLQKSMDNQSTVSKETNMIVKEIYHKMMEKD